jgi:hypothetical protein
LYAYDPISFTLDVLIEPLDIVVMVYWKYRLCWTSCKVCIIWCFRVPCLCWCPLQSKMLWDWYAGTIRIPLAEDCGDDHSAARPLPPAPSGVNLVQESAHALRISWEPNQPDNSQLIEKCYYCVGASGEDDVARCRDARKKTSTYLASTDFRRQLGNGERITAYVYCYNNFGIRGELAKSDTIPFVTSSPTVVVKLFQRNIDTLDQASDDIKYLSRYATNETLVECLYCAEHRSVENIVKIKGVKWTVSESKTLTSESKMMWVEANPAEPFGSPRQCTKLTHGWAHMMHGKHYYCHVIATSTNGMWRHAVSEVALKMDGTSAQLPDVRINLQMIAQQTKGWGNGFVLVRMRAPFVDTETAHARSTVQCTVLSQAVDDFTGHALVVSTGTIRNIGKRMAVQQWTEHELVNGQRVQCTVEEMNEAGCTVAYCKQTVVDNTAPVIENPATIVRNKLGTAEGPGGQDDNSEYLQRMELDDDGNVQLNCRTTVVDHESGIAVIRASVGTYPTGDDVVALTVVAPSCDPTQVVQCPNRRVVEWMSGPFAPQARMYCSFQVVNVNGYSSWTVSDLVRTDFSAPLTNAKALLPGHVPGLVPRYTDSGWCLHWNWGE